jgi:hypothetical protein
MRDKGLKGQDVVALCRLWVGTSKGYPNNPANVDTVISRRVLSYYEKKAWGDGEPPLFLVGINQKVLAGELGLSVAEMSLSVGRLQFSGLVNPDWSVRAEPFLRFLEWGVPFFLPPVQGPDVLGVPTAWGHPQVSLHLRGSNRRTPVWPSDVGEAMGPSLSPLYRTVPLVVRDNPRLHAALAAVDLLRLGGAREKEAAIIVLGELRS